MQQQDKRTRRNFLYQAVTVLLIIMIICTAGMIQFTVKPAKGSSKSLPVNNSVWFNEEGLSEPEKAVLSKLYTEIVFSDWQQDHTVNTYLIYLMNLKNYFMKEGIDLAQEQSDLVISKIENIQQIFSLEGKSDIGNMSMDGRGIAIDLFEQIYKICGLKIDANMTGEIEEIQDQTGNVIYQRQTTNISEEFQVYALISTLTIIISLLILSVIIVKKNQIFRRDVVYDGFDEERFA